MSKVKCGIRSVIVIGQKERTGLTDTSVVVGSGTLENVRSVQDPWTVALGSPAIPRASGPTLGPKEPSLKPKGPNEGPIFRARAHAHG